ncbi:mevalonate kinase family protein [Riemerella anatipestifer]|uniref:mevalonate kinase family protein n=1 Tax=Riemerella anatipestifer TaxID=34085 RepID=UPI0007EC9D04|nr:mevalonate kinase [Riemerella anatipestifer]MBT0527283.1 mevalonate kinase [Riemerella anatipestifer]MBT0529324.1 mevalonate kinase [Riemerella anatipestifer]MBT0531125.1 mevalonate kinase [Riemerella anatipestifer]MBT0533158.1 mevalonate kinase [Riemerella anatipestifer]MBT0534985.1 mevalonate kinase [Riemerella anatipestifer]
MANPLFYAKILLFGEYGIIENSQGLTLPYSFYKGTLKFSDLSSDFERQSNQSLLKYTDYLQSLALPKDFELNVSELKKDINKGLFFDSNIPQGYGVGSSGALVAAIFERYSLKKYNPEHISKEDLKQLKKVFGELESYFHGKSSGIDPLICYMNLPILIENKENVDRVSIPKEQQGKGAIFLIDSGVVGETGPMVQIFFEKLKQEGFRKTLKEEFIRYNNACIEAFLKKDMNPFFKNLRKLSLWAYENFRPMIPEGIFNVWKKGLDTNTYYLKLCGSGGGGYILGFTQDYDKAEKMLEGFKKEVIYRF